MVVKTQVGYLVIAFPQAMDNCKLLHHQNFLQKYFCFLGEGCSLASSMELGAAPICSLKDLTALSSAFEERLREYPLSRYLKHPNV